MKRFNGTDIDQTILYVKHHCGKFVRAVLERHIWSYPGKKEAEFVESIHHDSAKELKTTLVPSNDSEAYYTQDKTGFKYRYILGEIIFA